MVESLSPITAARPVSDRAVPIPSELINRSSMLMFMELTISFGVRIPENAITTAPVSAICHCGMPIFFVKINPRRTTIKVA